MSKRPLVKKNQLNLSGDVDTVMTACVLEYIIKHKALTKSSEVHTFFINSEGGSGQQGLQIANLIMTAPFTINTFAIGAVTSAAIAVFLAGEYRMCTEASQFLIHYGLENQASLPELMRNIEEFKNYKKLIMDRTGESATVVNQWHCTETFFNATKALNRGLVHKICAPW